MHAFYFSDSGGLPSGEWIHTKNLSYPLYQNLPPVEVWPYTSKKESDRRPIGDNVDRNSRFRPRDGDSVDFVASTSDKVEVDFVASVYAA